MTKPKDVIELLQALVRFPSLSYGEKEVADFVEAFVLDRGCRVERFDDNICVSLGDGRDHLLLNSHLDVVPPSSSHPHGAFDAKIVDGHIYGRGSVDAKASGASMLWAMLDLAASGFKPKEGRLTVALTTCEEVGKDYNGLEATLPKLPAVTSAIVGEPTELQPCVGQKGILILKLHARGKTAHAARSHLGVNAIAIAAKDVLAIQDMTFDKSDSFLGAPTTCVAKIEGGTAHNVVPDACSILVDVRSTPAYTHDEIIGLIDAQTESEIEVHSSRIIPVSTDPDARIVAACLTASEGSSAFGSPTASDWIYLKDQEVVKMGPGRSQLSHTPEEHVSIDEVRKAVHVYKSAVTNYFA